MHSKIEIVDILIADKLGRSTIYKELERRTHETWTCTNYRLDYMKKKKFIFIILVIVVVIVIGIFLRYQHTSPKRLADLSEQKYEQVHSSIDYDQDGIDEQTSFRELWIILTQNRSIRVNIITVVIRMIIMVCVRMW